MSDITQLETMKDVINMIQEKHPGWIIDFFDDYSDDYEELSRNWVKICDLFKTKPQKIMIVSKFECDDHYSFAELFTKAGFVVRTQYEFIPCLVCQRILPTKVTYDKLKEHNKPVTEVWSERCMSC